MQKYCYNCMYPLNGASFCGHCGAGIKSAPVCASYHLPCGTELCGKYVVGKVIGEGGFGITYIGIDTTLSKRVAIKEFYPSGIAERDNSISNAVNADKERRGFFRAGVERFLFEAKSIAAFSDEEGIVNVQEFFQENNTAYIVMDYLDGNNLKQHMKREGLFEPDELISLLMPVMSALKNMHAKGIIHRDISPDNIMYTKKGTLKLMDFGSARSYLDDEEQIAIILKQGFAPEEQFRQNGEQGPYTDVYALCATIYTCITGKVPPISRDRIKNDDLVPPSKLGINIRSAQEQALMHGLEVFAKDRTPNMETLIKEFTAKTPVDIETANTITYPAKSKQTKPETVDNTGKSKTPEESPDSEKKQPPASPNEYMNARKTTNATIIPKEQPAPPKPMWRTVLSIALPIVILLGILVAGIIILANHIGDNAKEQQETTVTSAQSSINIKDLLSGLDETRPTVDSSDKTEATTEFVPFTIPTPLSLDDAEEHAESLKSFFLDNVERNDSEARYGERIELYNIYYSESKSDPQTKYIAFLYCNASSKYYKVLYVPATQFSIKNDKLDYNSNLMYQADSDPTLEGAKEKCWCLSSAFSKQYENTEIF